MEVTPKKLKCVPSYLQPVHRFNVSSDIRKGNHALACHFADTFSATTLIPQSTVFVIALVVVTPSHVDSVGSQADVSRCRLIHTPQSFNIGTLRVTTQMGS